MEVRLKHNLAGRPPYGTGMVTIPEGETIQVLETEYTDTESLVQWRRWRLIVDRGTLITFELR